VFPSCIESLQDLVHAMVRIKDGVKGWSFTDARCVGGLTSDSGSLAMFRGGANGVNTRQICRREILCNNVNGQLITPMHQHETHTVTVFISGAPSRDRLTSEKPQVALVTCWFNYRFD
jgi:hypothetical protein